MTISTTESKISYNGNGTTTAFAFPYRFLANGDLVVIRVAADGTETTLVLNTDYTVTGADNDAGGTVTCSVAPASGARLVIYRSVALTQETDYISGDAFPAETHERALDRLTMISQQLQEEVDRSAKLPVTSTADAESLVADIIRIADSADNLDTVATNIADVNTVADDIANVNTTATNIASVNTTAMNIAVVNTVATNIVDIQNAEENANAAAASATLANDWATKTSAPVAGGEYSAKYHAQAAASSASTATTQASNAASSASAAAASESAAAASAAAAAASLDNFDDRYLGAKSSNPTLDNDGNPLVVGALYYRTTAPVGMKVYDGAQWLEASAAQQAALVTYEYVATAGQTTFSGADANALTLSYIAGGIIVSLNGVILRPGDDYTASNGTSVVLVNAASVNDELNVYAFSSFNVANTYTQAQSDAKYAQVAENNTFTKAQRGSITTLTDGATITPDFAANNHFQVTLGGNRTLANPTNLVAGQSGAIRIVQDGTGSRTLAYGSNWKFSNGAAPVLTTTANAVDLLVYFVESASRITARLISDVK